MGTHFRRGGVAGWVGVGLLGCRWRRRRCSFGGKDFWICALDWLTRFVRVPKSQSRTRKDVRGKGLLGRVTLVPVLVGDATPTTGRERNERKKVRETSVDSETIFTVSDV